MGEWGRHGYRGRFFEGTMVSRHPMPLHSRTLLKLLLCGLGCIVRLTRRLSASKTPGMFLVERYVHFPVLSSFVYIIRLVPKIPQLYLHFPVSSGEPPSVLRGFSNVKLQPTEKQTVTITLSRYDLSIWDVEKQGWRRTDGEIGFTVSRDGRLKGSVPV